jgi:hypothetical protein
MNRLAEKHYSRFEEIDAILVSFGSRHLMPSSSRRPDELCSGQAPR